MKANELKELFEVITSQKKVSVDQVKEALEDIIIRVYQRKVDPDVDMKVDFTVETGEIRAYVKKTIVETVNDEFIEIAATDPAAKGFKVGDSEYIEIDIYELPTSTFQQVKQMFRQSMKEQEEKYIYSKYEPMVGSLIQATIYRVGRGLLCNLEDATAFMHVSEYSKLDDYQPGKVMDFYILSVDEMAKDSQIKLSRANPGFVTEILKREIDDVAEGVITVHDVARMAGERSKISVSSSHAEVDPAGAIIGPKGSNIKRIMNILGGEKIDVIRYSEDEVEYIVEALSPANVAGVIIKKSETTNKETGEVSESRSATVIVEDDDLVQAIGKGGMNVKLAVKLTGFNIDIKSVSDAAAQEIEYEKLEGKKPFGSFTPIKNTVVEYDEILEIQSETGLDELDYNTDEKITSTFDEDEYDFDEEEIY